MKDSAGIRQDMIHLNTAGQGRLSAEVQTVLTKCVRLADRYGPHELEEHVEDVVHAEIHDRLATLLNAPQGHTELFTAGAAAFEALVGGLAPARGERIWTTPYESAAHLATLQSLRDRTRCRIEVVPLRADGDLDLEWMADHIDNDVALVSVAHVPATRGITHPVEDIGRILAPYRCLYAVDAAYSVGQLPLDVGRIGCHLLTGDGWRFLRGPREVGFAYVAPRLRAEPTLPADPFLEPAPFPATADVVALNAALAQHTPDRFERVQKLMPALLAAVEAVPGTRLLTPGRQQSSIVAFEHPKLPAALIRHRLAEQGVVVAKTVAEETPLLAREGSVTTTLRASLHEDNSEDGIGRFAQALSGVVGQQRSCRLPRLKDRRHLAAVPAPASAAVIEDTPTRRICGRKRNAQEAG
ncbi:aminotransferase class V-fold PLP-dependent enzyme [Streptomyces sp. NPDC050085]|uniref:aminotransferase class V-fold PLP-dependent enzyme n=1 Tax=Streptomyces sp. NPDC050085 TaxID=3365600 RepID=UPI0037928097